MHLDLSESPPSGCWRPELGARPTVGGTNFRVWAPKAETVEVVHESPDQPSVVHSLKRSEDGTFQGFVEGVQAGDRYRYRVDGRGPYPDPASRYQPEGVHGPSQVIDASKFGWTDSEWRGISPEDVVLYELHVGAFSPEGNFSGVTERLPALAELGVTAIELMPVADFPGSRNWGYDGVAIFAPARCYGAPDELRRLVDRAHGLGLAVFMDVVYNHFGPAANYTGCFSPLYLSSDHKNPWGSCVNLDGEGSAAVRHFFIENALHWINEYHIDGLRLDATHALVDESPKHFVAELATAVRSCNRRGALLFAEDHRNLDIMLRAEWAGGWDLDGVWADDFHHQLRRILAGDNEGYYRDYTDSLEELAATLKHGWFYTGQSSVHLAEPRGTDPAGIEPRRFVICLQNHDQIGNRAFGERLNQQIDTAAYRAASALLLTAPQTPLLFMGQEWASSSPFLYFTQHEQELGQLITDGRRHEFRHFAAFVDPEARKRIPDPQDPQTFARCKLDWSEREQETQAGVLKLYRALLKLRRSELSLRWATAVEHEVSVLDDGTLVLERSTRDGKRFLIVVRLRGSGVVDLARKPGLKLPAGNEWALVMTTEEPRFSPNPSPPRVDLSDQAPVIEFHCPAAVVLKVRRLEG